MPNIYAESARRKSRCKLVVMPRGTLSAWSLRRSRWKKLLAWYLLGQRAALQNADLLIATCDAEYQEIRAFGLRQPVAVVPNGIDIQERVYPKAARRKLLFLSRIHPKKGVDILLKVWKQLHQSFPEWDLMIAGPLNNEYAQNMIRFSEQLGCERVCFCGEVRGEAKSALLGECEILVLPTHSENFGMVVAEALAAGTAVICSHGAPWQGLDNHQCGLWIELGEESLLKSLEKTMRSSRTELTEMGLRGREWMRQDFSWEEIGREYMAAYCWLLGNGEKPKFIFCE